MQKKVNLIGWSGLALALVLLSLFLTSPALAQGPTPPSVPPPASRPSAVRAKDLFQQNCVPCHGQAGRGDGEVLRAQGQTAPSFAGFEFHLGMTPAETYNTISEGRVGKLMPPWKNRLTPDQMWDLTVYSWWVGTSVRSLARGQTVWGAECASCHGANGASRPTSDLSRPTSYLNRNQTDLLISSAQVPQHKDTWAKLSAADRQAVMDYARSLSFDAPPLPPMNGSIRGSIKNGTGGASIAPGQVVSATLLTFVGSGPEAPISTTVQSDGSFAFDGLPVDAQYSYGVGTRYKGVDYFSPLIRLTSDQPGQPAPITVYETTTTNPGLRLGQVHVIADFLDEKTLRVGELYEVVNPGERTFVPASGATSFDLPLPTGATNVRFQDEEAQQALTQTGDTARLALPWPPGKNQLLVSYDLSYSGNLRLSRAWPYAADAVNILVVDVGLQVQAEGVQAGQPMDSPQGGRFLSYAAANVPPQQAVTVNLRGTPRDTTSGAAASGSNVATNVRVQNSYQDTLRWLGLAVVALALALALVWPRFRRATAVNPRAALIGQRERLLDELADLDDSFAAGEVGETEYTMRRAATKARLIPVMRALRVEE